MCRKKYDCSFEENGCAGKDSRAGYIGQCQVLILFALLDKELMVYPHQPVKIHTGIALSMPDNQMVGLVYPRSGLASKFGLIPSNCVGVIDSDYRGEIMVSLTESALKPLIV